MIDDVDVDRSAGRVGEVDRDRHRVTPPCSGVDVGRGDVAGTEVAGGTDTAVRSSRGRGGGRGRLRHGARRGGGVGSADLIGVGELDAGGGTTTPPTAP